MIHFDLSGGLYVLPKDRAGWLEGLHSRSLLFGQSAIMDRLRKRTKTPFVLRIVTEASPELVYLKLEDMTLPGAYDLEDLGLLDFKTCLKIEHEFIRKRKRP